MKQKHPTRPAKTAVRNVRGQFVPLKKAPKPPASSDKPEGPEPGTDGSIVLLPQH